MMSAVTAAAAATADDDDDALDRVPEYVLQLLFGYLPPPHLLRCRGVCKRFKACAESEIVWAPYRCDLLMRLGPSKPLATVAAWNRMLASRTPSWIVYIQIRLEAGLVNHVNALQLCKGSMVKLRQYADAYWNHFEMLMRTLARLAPVRPPAVPCCQLFSIASLICDVVHNMHVMYTKMVSKMHFHRLMTLTACQIVDRVRHLECLCEMGAKTKKSGGRHRTTAAAESAHEAAYAAFMQGELASPTYWGRAMALASSADLTRLLLGAPCIGHADAEKANPNPAAPVSAPVPAAMPDAALVQRLFAPDMMHMYRIIERETVEMVRVGTLVSLHRDVLNKKVVCGVPLAMLVGAVPFVFEADLNRLLLTRVDAQAAKYAAGLDRRRERRRRRKSSSGMGRASVRLSAEDDGDVDDDGSANNEADGSVQPPGSKRRRIAGTTPPSATALAARSSEMTTTSPASPVAKTTKKKQKNKK
jgi:hypothetical protein